MIGDELPIAGFTENSLSEYFWYLGADMYTKDDALQIMKRIDAEIIEKQKELESVDQKVEEDLRRLMQKYEREVVPEKIEELNDKYGEELARRKSEAINKTLIKLQQIKERLQIALGMTP